MRSLFGSPWPRWSRPIRGRNHRFRRSEGAAACVLTLLFVLAWCFQEALAVARRKSAVNFRATRARHSAMALLGSAPITDEVTLEVGHKICLIALFCRHLILGTKRALGFWSFSGSGGLQSGRTSKEGGRGGTRESRRREAAWTMELAEA